MFDLECIVYQYGGFPLFALERYRFIDKYLDEKKQVEVHALSELLDVSEVTIRRDLEKMEKNGLLVRTHGGAVRIEEEAGDSPEPDNQFGDREGNAVHLELIQEIAATAARLVMDGDTIMLFSGPLCRALARQLQDKQSLTILTNDIDIASGFNRSGNKRLVLLGGDLNPDERAVFGTLTMDDLQRFHVDRLFTEVDGCGKNFELSVHTQEKAMLVREGRQRTEEFVILCLASGFEKSAFYSFGSARSGDLLVTDRTVPDEIKQRFFDANLRMYTAPDIFEGAV